MSMLSSYNPDAILRRSATISVALPIFLAQAYSSPVTRKVMLVAAATFTVQMLSASLLDYPVTPVVTAAIVLTTISASIIAHRYFTAIQSAKQSPLLPVMLLHLSTSNTNRNEKASESDDEGSETKSTGGSASTDETDGEDQEVVLNDNLSTASGSDSEEENTTSNTQLPQAENPSQAESQIRTTSAADLLAARVEKTSDDEAESPKKVGPGTLTLKDGCVVHFARNSEGIPFGPAYQVSKDRTRIIFFAYNEEGKRHGPALEIGMVGLGIMQGICNRGTYIKNTAPAPVDVDPTAVVEKQVQKLGDNLTFEYETVGGVWHGNAKITKDGTSVEFRFEKGVLVNHFNKHEKTGLLAGAMITYKQEKGLPHGKATVSKDHTTQEAEYNRGNLSMDLTKSDSDEE